MTRKYVYWYAWINGVEKLNLLKQMIKLFEYAEIADIEEAEVDDEEWGMYEAGYHVRIRLDMARYNGNWEIMYNGFDMVEETYHK